MRTAVMLLLLIGCSEPPTTISWTSNPEQAAREHKPALVWFSAAWDMADVEMERTTFQDAEVIDEAQRFRCVHIDMTNGNENPLMRRYGGRGVPFIVLIGSGGTQAASIHSFTNASELLVQMRAVR